VPETQISPPIFEFTLQQQEKLLLLRNSSGSCYIKQNLAIYIPGKHEFRFRQQSIFVANFWGLSS